MAKPTSTPAYPASLRDAEDKLLGPRRASETRIGVALSGGGVRSATFALGVFQAWAKRRFIRRIHFISSVSGGGYFGAFLGRLFTRDYVRNVSDIEWLLGADAEDGQAQQQQPVNEKATLLQTARRHVIEWLRENGRYMAPRGAGDLLLASAAMLRNWLTIHILLGFLALGVLLAAQAPRIMSDWWPNPGAAHAAVSLALSHFPGQGPWLWWSPWSLASLVMFALVIPYSWAYWLVSRGSAGRVSIIGTLAILTVVGLLRWQFPAFAPLGLLILTSALAAGAIGGFLLAGLESLRVRKRIGESDPASFDSARRNALTGALKTLIVVVVAIGVLGLADTLGQTLYGLWSSGEASALNKWAAGIGGAFVALAGFARQIVVLAGAKPDGKRPKLPITVVAGLAAFILTFSLAVAYSMLAHAIVWDFGAARTPPALIPHDRMSSLHVEAPGASSVAMFVTAPAVPPGPNDARRIPMQAWAVWLAVILAAGVALGRSRALVNSTGHQQIYSARLTRAYLGASNPARWTGKPASVGTPVPGDDASMGDYWKTPGAAGPPDTKAAPIHIVNVTINETIGGRSQVEQQDRRGLGMAIGPAALSAGATHHVLLQRDMGDDARQAHSHYAALALGQPESGFRIFEYDQPRFGEHTNAAETRPPAFPRGALTIGQWIGISGAAFSTGLGARTSRGLSLLAGLTNIRLGYWWNSGIDLETREKFAVESKRLGARFGRAFELVMPVQKYLIDEFLARFPGVAGHYWYLSDGGHFENMGAYELIRRRLDVIVIVDAEQDEKYYFGGLSELVRKARLDFGAEVTFISPSDTTAFDGRLPSTFGQLENLRPECPPEKEKCEEDALRFSQARFAIATVQYDDEPSDQKHWLFYIKPTMLGTEPKDIIHYARSNQPFPHQTTADQFFDEAQWESYRKLGEISGAAFIDGLGGPELSILASTSPAPRDTSVPSRMLD